MVVAVVSFNRTERDCDGRVPTGLQLGGYNHSATGPNHVAIDKFPKLQSNLHVWFRTAMSKMNRY